jgi:hypothetical protein
LPNAPSLAYLMEQCQSLKVLILVQLRLEENHCRVLGAYSRPDLEIELIACTLTNAGSSALAEVLGRNQGPTTLYHCDIDYLDIADGMRGNSRLKCLIPSISNKRQEVLAIAGALRENNGLVEMNLCYFGFRMSDEMWATVYDSLKTHPTLKVLTLRATDEPMAPAVDKSRIQSLSDMMRVNISIHTIHLGPGYSYRYSQHELYRESVISYLKTNRLRLRVRVVRNTRPITYRAKVLGRALLSARTNPNSFWMLLSRNLQVSFPSLTATAMLVTNGNLPTPATAATSVNAQPWNE